MKRTLIAILILWISQFSFSQNQERCQEIAKTVLEAVIQKDFETIKPYLTEDFEIGGQKTPIAEIVLKQLITQLTLEKYTLINKNLSNDCLTIHYDVKYKSLKNKKALLGFNSDNKIKRIELLKIEVKNLKKDETKIEQNSSNLIEIPFIETNKLVLVKAKINGIERDFILDSGAPTTILNAKYVKQQDVESISSTKGVTGSNLSGLDIQKYSIDFYGIRTNKQKTLIADLSNLEKDRTKVYGLIGYDFLKKYDVLFDYERKIITLIQPHYFDTYKKEKLSKYHQIETVPMTLRGHIPILSVNILEKNYHMGVDCGATSNILDEKFYNDIKTGLNNENINTLIGASKKKKKMKTATLRNLYIGKSRYKNTNFGFTDISHLNNNKKILIDGLIGYEFLSKQPTLLSYQRKEIVLIQ